MKKSIVILMFILLLAAASVPASAQEPAPGYRYAKWQGIWQAEPVESTVGGDAWKVNGKWVTGYFTKTGVWVRPGKRTPSSDFAGWYTPMGVQRHSRHSWAGCGPGRRPHVRKVKRWVR